MSEPLPPPQPLNPNFISSSLFDGKSYRDSMSSPLMPNNLSHDHLHMSGYWHMVEHMIGGTESMRKARERYLPKFPGEEKDDYEYRLANSVFTNIYSDIVNHLAAKPFAEECQMIDPVAPFDTYADNIDGRGNSIHVFAQESFFWGINFAIDWILVEYPKKPTRRMMTVADEKAQGLRPYWVHVTAPRMLAVYSDSINGHELFTHARIGEITRQRSGFGEVVTERVRVFNREPIIDEATGRAVGYQPATFELWEKQSQSGSPNTTNAWKIVDAGPITIGIIPIVPFIAGKRLDSSWQFVPVMRDCAYAQIEHYQQETNLKGTKELTAFPMLSGDGVSPPGPKDPEIKTGPRRVLFAPPAEAGSGTAHGAWKFIEPQGQSLTFLAAELDRLEKQMRELGRQPLTAASGNLTVVTASVMAQKGNSACQQWALNLKDALEQALVITAMWLGQNPERAPAVQIFTDFQLDLNDDVGPPTLTSMRSSGDLSQRTLWEEMQRRNILSGNFDADEEEKRIADEQPPPPTAADITAAMALTKPQLQQPMAKKPAPKAKAKAKA